MSKPSIIIAGDLCLHGRTEKLPAKQLISLFKDLTPIIQSVDMALVNLETAIVDTDICPIKKAGPVIKSGARIIDVIRSIGFKGVTLANNHFADYGHSGVEESLQLLQKGNLWYVGAGMDAEQASKVKYSLFSGKKIAVINACEHEFTIATETSAGCNALKPLKMCLQIKEAKAQADYVFVIVHGGHEHYNLPAPRMQELYRSFVEFGADAVINHHQHCFSGYEIYKKKPIVYGLGNFFFDWQGQSPDWNEGYLVKLELGEEITMVLIPYIQNAESLGVRLMNEEEKEKFYEKIGILNTIIDNPKLLQQHLTDWAENVRKNYLRILAPEIGKRVRLLDKLHLIPIPHCDYWMPEYFTEERKLLLKSLFQCESHQEIMNIILQ